MQSLKKFSSVSEQIPVQGIRKLMEVSSKLSDVIHLEVGEPNVDTPGYIRDAAIYAMENGETHYTPNAGTLSLRRAIVNHLQNKYNLSIEVDQIAVTAGAVNALMISLLAVVDEGEEVLIPDPAWPNYEIMLSILGAVPKRYELDPSSDFKPDFSQLDKLITHKTKAILVNSPNNPTGVVYEKEILIKMIEFAKKYNLYIISDEVYDEITFDRKHHCMKSFDHEDRVISIFSFSKSYAMTGWRVGYAVGSNEFIERMTKLIEPIISCAPSFSQKAAEIALENSQQFLEEMRSIYRSRRDKVYKLLIENKIKAYYPEGTFYMLIDISSTGIPSNKFALKLLHEEKVSVGPGDTFGHITKNMIRISLATEELQLLEGVKRICNFIRKYSKI